jgi:beta-glucosidase
MSDLFQTQIDAIKSGSTTIVQATEAIFSQLRDDEKLWMLDGDDGFKDFMIKMATAGYCHTPQYAGFVERLGIPGIRFSDGPRGVLLGGKGTAFPVSSSRAATFNPGLEEEVVSAAYILSNGVAKTH